LTVLGNILRLNRLNSLQPKDFGVQVSEHMLSNGVSDADANFENVFDSFDAGRKYKDATSEQRSVTGKLLEMLL